MNELKESDCLNTFFHRLTQDTELLKFSIKWALIFVISLSVIFQGITINHKAPDDITLQHDSKNGTGIKINHYNNYGSFK